MAADRLGVDPLRLYLVKEIAFGGDGDFSWDRYEERYNVDLANNLGNLVSRVTSMAHRYRGGRVAPVSSKPLRYEKTEYASPRRSRISWNSRDDIPPPSAWLSTDKA